MESKKQHRGEMRPHFGMTDAAKTQVLARPPGSLRAHVGGVAIDLHWSCVIGGIALSAAGGFRRELLIPLVIAYILLVFVHELGHAIAARLLGVKVYVIRLVGMGGLCITESPSGPLAILVVFSSGIIAQLLLLVTTIFSSRQWQGYQSPVFNCFVFVFTIGNAIMLALGLLPRKQRNQQSDVRVLIQLAIDLWHGRTVFAVDLPVMNSMEESPVFPPETALVNIPRLLPSGFSQETRDSK